MSTGTVTSLTVTATDSTVSASTTYTVTIKPAHAIPSSNKIEIVFPSSILLTFSSSCTLSSVSGGISTSAGCKVSSNTVTITNAFGTGSFSKGGAAFSFVFSSGGTNPDSVRDAGTFSVKTYATISSNDYAIDSSDFTNVFTPTAATLTASVSLVSSYVAYFSTS